MVFTPEEREERRRKSEAHKPKKEALLRRNKNDLDVLVVRPLRCAMLFYLSVVDTEALDYERDLKDNIEGYRDFVEAARSGFEKLVRKMDREVSEVSNG